MLFYLSSTAVRELLSGAAALSGAHAEFAADTFGSGLLRVPGMQNRTPFCTDEPAALLRSCGWPECDLTEPGQSRANYGRLKRMPEDWTGGNDPTMRTYLVVASKK